MQPLNNNVLVELVENDGVIKTVSDRNVVARVKELPLLTEKDSPGWAFVTRDKYINIGSKVICEQVREYLAGNERFYFTRLEDIVCVL